MPWKDQTPMSQRQAFVEQAQQPEANISHLCRRYGISRKTAYKWLSRYRDQGVAGLSEQSRRPHHHPWQTPAEVEEWIVRAREKHPTWGARKLKAWLEQQGGVSDLPALSTITVILQRQGCIDPAEALKHRPYHRFERAEPNALWQMDFKGEVVLADGSVCYPLSVLDDYSRFLLALPACANMTQATVQTRVTTVFRNYGLPMQMLMDNGVPWGYTREQPYTAFSVWLMRLGIRVTHGRPYHPQTQGKVERFHRTLNAELTRVAPFPDRPACHAYLTRWRADYNLERPHEALADWPPVTAYQASPRPFPETLPPIEYEPGATVRKVQRDGKLSFRGRACRVSTAFRGQPVAIRPDPLAEAVYEVYFVNTRIAVLDFKANHYPLS